jgi:spore maturation protein CgeB
MRILFLGDLDTGQTAGMRMRALARLGHDVRGVHTNAPWRAASWAARQINRRLTRGPIVARLNRGVLDAARDHRPDLVWADKQEYLTRETVEALGARGRVAHFTPDPYFALAWKRTPLMDAALPAFHALIYCKTYERAAYEALGPATFYMPLGYCDEVHRPMPDAPPRWRATAGFVGGWEPRRERLLNALAGAGVDLRILGAYWEMLADGRWTPRRAIIRRQLAGGDPMPLRANPALARAHAGGEVYGDDYARALSAAAIGLGFLRRVCPDQHTTRTFEIPACGSLLLADRTDEHRDLFDEGREAEFFGDAAELVDKVQFYAAHDAARARVAAAGRARAVRSGYAYIHRLRALLDRMLAS